MTPDVPAILIAGTHSGCGKTTATLAVLAALVRRGLRVQGFKVGPDFIDPGHHARITGRPGRNLDTWLLGPDALADVYRRGADGADIAVIEGVMGLFDGRGPLDESGSGADLARRWDLPVVLVVDAKGLARSIAPMVRGFAEFDPSVRVVAAVANRVGGAKHHDEYLAPALRVSCGVESLGYLTRDPAIAIPSRHLGLVMAGEVDESGEPINRLADSAEEGLDLDRLMALAAPPRLPPPRPTSGTILDGRRVRLALARDRAFGFYYEDNLDLLRQVGAEILPFSPLEDDRLPVGTEFLYLGGGYPELHARQIAENDPMRAAIRRFHSEGGPILAECGGLMACCRSLRDLSGREFPMWDLIPARVAMQERFAALGYVTARGDRETLLGPEGTEVRGHEFHYSTFEPLGPIPYATRLFRPDREPRPDGIQVGGLLAGYAHLHFGSNAVAVGSLLASGRGVEAPRSG